MELKYIVKNEVNIRQVLREKFGISERLLIKLKKSKKIFLNGDNNIYVDKLIKPKDEVKINLDFEEDNSNIVPIKMNLDILYEDDAFIILNKPPHMPVHPSINHYEDSLCNGVKYYFNSINLKRKIRPINRLDKDTSGIVIFAKNEYVQDKMNGYTKEYLTVVTGKLTDNGFITKPIARKKNSIIERCINEFGEKAITEYYVLKNFKINNQELSLVKCILHTGKTHQIRVHMSSILHPILGDTLYGTVSSHINRQALHAYKVQFLHPISKKIIEVVAPIPRDINKIIKYE